MTAMNLFKQQDAAYILTDTAIYRATDATVVAFGAKVVELATLPVAIGIHGEGIMPQDLVDWFNRVKPQSTDDVLLTIPDMLREIKRQACRKWSGRNEMGVGIAMFRYETERVEAWRCDTFNGWLGDWYEPYSLAPALASIGYRMDGDRFLGVDELVGRPVTVEDAGSFDPRVDGLALIEAQRRLPSRSYGDASEPHYVVGGQAVLTRVDMCGTRHEVLATWPDRVGERIKPGADQRVDPRLNE